MFETWRRCWRRTIEGAYQRIPLETRWGLAQRRYTRWADTPLPTDYLAYVLRLGAELREFIGTPTRLIDVGCGNGVIDGRSYGEVGYQPIKLGGYVLGIDPLPIIHPIPWINDFKQVKAEDLREEGYHQAAFVTSFPHIADPYNAMRRLKDAGVDQIFFWESLFKTPTSGDRDHPHRYTYPDLEWLLFSHRFKITREKLVDSNPLADGYFLEANME